MVEFCIDTENNNEMYFTCDRFNLNMQVNEIVFLGSMLPILKKGAIDGSFSE